MLAQKKDCQCVSFTVLRAWIKYKREMKKIPVHMLVLCGTIAVLALTSFACILYAVVVRCKFVSDKVCATCGKANWEIAGTFGDSFGAINAFFSGLNVFVAALAFFGFLYALKLQREDLRLQRREMENTRREMALQTHELNEQTRIQKEAQETQARQQTEQLLSAAMANYAERMYKLRDEGWADCNAGEKIDSEDLFRELVEYVSAYIRVDKREERICGIYARLLCLEKVLMSLTPYASMFIMWKGKVKSTCLKDWDKLRYMAELESVFSDADKYIASLCLIRRKLVRWDESELNRLNSHLSTKCDSLRAIAMEVSLLSCSSEEKMQTAYAVYKLLSYSVPVKGDTKTALAATIEKSLEDYHRLPQNRKWFPNHWLEKNKANK